MRSIIIFLCACVTVPILAQGTRALVPDPPSNCSDCAEWNAPQAPFRVFGNTYYVGPAGLSSVLITSDEGLVLVDAALPQSAAPIDKSIRALGFDPTKIKVIASAHPHYDHAGGIAALQRATGATVIASASSAQALRAGAPTPDDPQFAFGPVMRFPAVLNVRVVADNEVVRVGPLAITAHYTPGHTPGSTAWSWQSCEGSRCLNVVYADSLTSVSAPGFRYTGDAKTPSIEASFRNSIATVEQLPCDVLLSAHPGFSGMAEKLKRRAGKPATDPFIDPGGCRAYTADARTRLDARIAEERK